MPRIPSAFDLGGLPRGDSGRPIARIDTTAIGQGVAALGAGLNDASVNLDRIAERETLRGDTLDTARATSRLLTGMVELDDEFSKDTNYTDLPKRYQERLQKIHDEAAGYIADPRKRELFTLSRSDDIARGMARANGIARKHEADANVADAQTRLLSNRDNALKTTDQAEQDTIIESSRGIIEGLHERGFISAETARAQKRAWSLDFAAAWTKTQSIEKQLEVLRDAPKDDAQTLERILGIEGTAKNPKSSAVGAGQFINSTWLDVVKRNRPDIAKGRSDDELLALRGDKALGKEMTDVYRRENMAYLSGKGVDPTPTNQYLAHFLGPAGAVAVAKAAPGTPVIEALTDAVGAKKAKAMVEANPTILSGKTADGVVAWSARKMGDGTSGTPADLLPQDQRVALRQGAERALLQRQTAESSARSEQWERHIIDAVAGKATLVPREQIEIDPALDEARRNALLKSYDSAASGVQKLQQFMTRYKDGGTFNPFDTDDRKGVDGVYRALGGDAKGENIHALNAVVDRTRILPETVGKSMRGELVSGDEKRVTSALQKANNLLGKQETIFTKVDGGSELEDAAIKFRHYVDDRGMTSEEAARLYIKEQTPEYKASVKARIKTEDIDAKLRKEVTINDLGASFDPSWGWMRDPTVGFAPKQRGAVFSQYSEIVKEHYLENGDMALAKKFAARTIGKTWGVTNVNAAAGVTGGGTVMQYPPERAAAYAGIENLSDKIAADAIATVKDQAKVDVARGDIMLVPIPLATARAHKAGEKVPYQLFYRDKNSHWQAIQPGEGKAFTPNPVVMKSAQSAERKDALETRDGMRRDPTGLAAARAKPPHRRTAEDHRAIAAAQPDGDAVAQVDAEPFERVVSTEKQQPGIDLSKLTQLPPQRRPKVTQPSQVSGQIPVQP